jgi:glycine cleavage system H protein
VVLQDGGEIADHALAELPEEIWDEFQDKFLN